MKYYPAPQQLYFAPGAKFCMVFILLVISVGSKKLANAYLNFCPWCTEHTTLTVALLLSIKLLRNSKKDVLRVKNCIQMSNYFSINVCCFPFFLLFDSEVPPKC